MTLGNNILWSGHASQRRAHTHTRAYISTRKKETGHLDATAVDRPDQSRPGTQIRNKKVRTQHHPTHNNKKRNKTAAARRRPRAQASSDEKLRGACVRV